MKKEVKIKVTKNGPYQISGNIPLDKLEINIDKYACPVEYKKIKEYQTKESYSLCRCGNSSNKPFCDGTHIKTNFIAKDIVETNSYLDRADTIEGNNFILKDDFSLCTGAGFCHIKNSNVWDLIKSKDEKLNKIAIKRIGDCDSGRLVVIDKKTKKSIEPNFKPHISILYEPYNKVGSSIWVKGNIPIESSEGKLYEKRNRVTLCRCGKSTNIPFCDASHKNNNFQDD